MRFKGRSPRTWLTTTRDFVWPRMSLSRLWAYYKKRISRLPGTPHSIAAGFAAGAAVSFTPFMGLHFVLGALVAYLLRGNLIASALGTLVGNPWTFPLIWVAIYEIGSSILPGDGTKVSLNDLSFTYLMAHIGDVLLPMMLGGAVLSVVVWPIFYFPIVRMIEKLRRSRLGRSRKNAALGRETA